MEFEVLADARSAEELSEALLQAGALAVSIEDAEPVSGDRPESVSVYAQAPGEFSGLWPVNRLRVLLAPHIYPDRLLAQACGAGQAGPTIVAMRRIGEADWVHASQSQFVPIRIGGLWIVPSWAEPPDPSALNLRLDPGMAFGTGSHPTTSLCLQWLQQNVRPGDRVLDYGCGSGILAIAAAKLGAGSVCGVDIDPLALQAASENSRRNGVQADYTDPASLDGCGLFGRFDIVVANILANPLIQLAPSLLRLLGQTGSIALAGLLAWQADELAAAYRRADPRLHLDVWGRDGDWVCVAGGRTVG